MEEKGPPNVRLIEVQPVTEGESSLPPIRGRYRTSTRKKGRQALNKSKSATAKSRELPELKKPKSAETVGSIQDAELIYVKPINDDPLTPREDDVKEIKKESAEDTETEELNGKRKKKTKRRKKNSVLPLDVTDSDDLDEAHAEPRKEENAGEPDNGKDKKKKTKKKKSKKNKKEKENKEPEPIKTKREPEQEIVAHPLQTDDKADGKKRGRKLPCCFGFIATWLAKRKQKRRDKKKKAIADRESPPKLVEYQHKKSKGGEAFVIEVDSRPMIHKPLLPPIQQTSGPIRRADYKLQTAEARRNEELAKRKAAARKHEKKKAECQERKEDADFHFRKKARLTIRYKQADAERNRNNLSRRAITRPISVQSSPSESVINENGPDARKLNS